MRDNPLHVAAYGDDAERHLRCHARLMRAVLGAFPAQQPICARGAKRRYVAAWRATAEAGDALQVS